MKAAKRSLRSRTVADSIRASEALLARSAAIESSTNPSLNIHEKAESSPSKRIRLRTPKPLSKRIGREVFEQTETVNDNSRAADPLDRPAEPHKTNAPLITPRGSRLVTYTKETLAASPSKTGLPQPSTTTGHILEDACAHLIRVEPRLKPLIQKHYCHVFCPEGLAEPCDPFKSLCSGIMAQQVSGAAASSIKRKFVGLFHDQLPEDRKADDELAFPQPNQVAECTVPFLRQAGLSERKAEYIKGLAERFTSGELSATMLINASDEEVLEKLTAVRGLGRWSVEMFACFGLKRMDVLSTGDLGVQ